MDDHPGWVIFDMDGTLVESEQLWQAVRREYVLAHGGRWHDGAQAEMIGMRTEEWARYVRDALGVDVAPETIAREVVAQVVARLSARVPVLPGAARALEGLAPTFTLGLATSATEIVARTVLAKAGWERFFSVVVSADSVARGKPAPDVYLRALQLLGADPRRAAAVEDSGNGIRSAHAADLVVIAIPNQAFPPDADALALASRVLPSLRELDAGVVRSLLDSSVA